MYSKQRDVEWGGCQSPIERRPRSEPAAPAPELPGSGGEGQRLEVGQPSRQDRGPCQAVPWRNSAPDWPLRRPGGGTQCLEQRLLEAGQAILPSEQVAGCRQRQQGQKRPRGVHHRCRHPAGTAPLSSGVVIAAGQTPAQRPLPSHLANHAFRPGQRKLASRSADRPGPGTGRGPARRTSR